MVFLSWFFRPTKKYQEGTKIRHRRKIIEDGEIPLWKSPFAGFSIFYCITIIEEKNVFSGMWRISYCEIKLWLIKNKLTYKWDQITLSNAYSRNLKQCKFSNLCIPVLIGIIFKLSDERWFAQGWGSSYQISFLSDIFKDSN